MSMLLDLGTKPAGLTVKTYGHGHGLMADTVYLGDYEISLRDFLCTAAYVLTNTDLAPNDPRRQFVECVRSMREVNGYNPGQKRLEPSVLPTLPA